MSVPALLGAVVVGGVLAVAGLAKLLRPVAPAGELAGRGQAGLLANPFVLRGLGALEVGIAAGLFVFGRPAMVSAALLLAGFTGWQGLELARGHTGAPCACFGQRTTIGWRSTASTLGVASLATVLAALGAPKTGLSATAALALACGLLAIVSLTLASIAFSLAREVARLRTRLGQTPPRGALEIAEEGPAIGLECPLIERFEATQAELALAVFVSPGCAICGELEPAITQLAAQPGLELVVFDELRDQLAWHSASIPGSPYAVAMTLQGMTLAKGTFNTFEQLSSIPATARQRLGEGLAHV